MKIKRKQSSLSLGKVLIPIFAIALLWVVVSRISSKNTTTSENQSPEEASPSSETIFDGATFELDIKKDALEKLKAKRDEALTVGLLYSSKDDLVDAEVRIDGKSYPCKLRLKGDLMDHLNGDRWSFRILLKGKEEWNEMNIINIHNSKARSHTAEWIMHKIFRDEGIIVPQYDFIKVKLNDKDLGVYAYEHHFENQLLENNNRQIGPILKHNDDAYWENVQKKLTPFPWVEASDIELFNKENISDPAFVRSFDLGHSMLADFLYERKSASEVFDLEIMARYYALMDLSHAWHAQQFTNIRFYLNQLSGKLEPIGYDCFGDYLQKVNADWDAFGQGVNSRASKEQMYDRGNVYRYLMYKNEDFFSRYMHYLEQYTRPEYLKGVRVKYKNEIASRVTFIKSDEAYKDHEDSWDMMFKKAAFTYKKLHPKPALSLKASRIKNSKSHIELKSFHYFPMEVIGFGSQEEMTDTLSKPIVLEAYNNKIPVREYAYRHHSEIAYVYYRTLGLSSVHKSALGKVSVPQENVGLASGDISTIEALPFLSRTGKTFAIPSGIHKVNQAIVIPSDYTLEIGAGAELHFGMNGSLLSRAKVMALGTAKNPIKFIGGERNRSGLFVSAEGKKSNFDHCHFIGLGNYANANVVSEAAVSIYKGEAEFSNCYFKNIKAKQSFASLYATTEMKKCEFVQSKGSGIVSKYSALKLTDITMEDIGNNGLTVESGSLDAVNVNLKSVLNTAMEFRENAKVYVYSIGAANSNQGLFVSGHSKVKIESIWLEDLEKGIEVRGNEVPVTNVEIGKIIDKRVKRMYLLKDGVQLTVAGKAEKG